MPSLGQLKADNGEMMGAMKEEINDLRAKMKEVNAKLLQDCGGQQLAELSPSPLKAASADNCEWGCGQ